VSWEYTPGSDLYFVYTDARDSREPGSPQTIRSMAMKLTRLLRF